MNEQGYIYLTLNSFTTHTNFIGLANTNVEGDLKVEHSNLDLKLGLLNLAGKYNLKLQSIIGLKVINDRYKQNSCFKASKNYI